MQVPCGQCIGCRLERSRQWAVRCQHEAALWEDNCFITLTYRPEDLPEDLSVNVRHFQLFMKRLRRSVDHKIRFFHCGEYGEKNGRPHYHAILFNHDFEDKKLWKVVNGNRLYTSESLERHWRLGFCSVGAASFQSSAYVARYLMKKIVGAASARHYEWVDPETGQIHQRSPEYVTMSRRPGIGSAWIERFGPSDVWPGDFVVVDGRKMRPPKAYFRKLESDNPHRHGEIQRQRQEINRLHRDNQTPERLAVREKVQAARLSQLKRGEVD